MVACPNARGGDSACCTAEGTTGDSLSDASPRRASCNSGRSGMAWHCCLIVARLRHSVACADCAYADCLCKSKKTESVPSRKKSFTFTGSARSRNAMEHTAEPIRTMTKPWDSAGGGDSTDAQSAHMWAAHPRPLIASTRRRIACRRRTGTCLRCVAAARISMLSVGRQLKAAISVSQHTRRGAGMARRA